MVRTYKRIITNTGAATMFTDKLHETTHNLNDVNLLVNLLSEFNISPEQALEGTGIDNGQLNDPSALVSHQQELKLFNNVRSLAPAKEIGILAAKRSDIASFGILGSFSKISLGYGPWNLSRVFT